MDVIFLYNRAFLSFLPSFNAQSSAVFYHGSQKKTEPNRFANSAGRFRFAQWKTLFVKTGIFLAWVGGERGSERVARNQTMDHIDLTRAACTG
jgi:hypothetical protein